MQLPKYITVDFLKELKNKAEENPSRTKYLQTAESCQLWYRGIYTINPLTGFDDMEVDERLVAARVNKIAQVVDKVSSIFMKNEPVVRRWPYRPEDAELSDQIDAMYQQAWDDTDGQMVARSMLNESLITGMSVCKIYWNPLDTNYSKHGQIAIEKLSPESLFFDPEASNMHRGQDCRYIIHHTQKPLWWIVDKYGVEGEIALGIRDARGQVRKPGVMRSIGKSASEIVSRLRERVSGFISKEPEDKEDLFEFWLFPRTMYASTMVGGDEIEPDLYPYGLVVTLLRDTIIHSMPNPFQASKKVEKVDQYGLPTTETVKIGHKRHPFVIQYWKRQVDPNGKGVYSIYDCAGAVEPMIPLQFNANNLRRNISVNSGTLANPTVVINKAGLVNPPDTLTWAHGQILETQANYTAEQVVRVLEGTAMPPQVFEFLMNEYREIELSAALEPGVVSLFPGGTSHTPPLTIGALQESAFGPLWIYVAELGATLLDMSILYDGLIQQKYPPDLYMTVSREGVQYWVEWTNKHITANFRRRVVSGASTALYDIDKDQRVAGVAMIANNAIMSQNPDIIEIAIAQIQALDFPWSYSILQLLQKVLDRLKQTEAGLQMVGAVNIAGGLMPQGMQGQEMLPQGEEGVEGPVGNPERLSSPTDYSGLADLASQLGVPLNDLENSLNSD